MTHQMTPDAVQIPNTGRLEAATHTAPGALPTRVFRKDILRAGRFTNAKAGWARTWSEADLDKMAQTFSLMQTNGVRVEVTKDHGQSAEDVIGFARSIYREGDRLYAELELRGESAIELAQRADQVSVEIEDLTDGEGRTYPEAITAVSVVRQPVINDQGSMIAASLRGGDRKVLQLSFVGDSINPQNGRDKPDQKKGNGMQIDLAAINAACGFKGEDALTEDNFTERVKHLSLEAGKVPDLSTKVEDLTTKTADLESKLPKDDNPAMREVLAERQADARDKISGLVGKTITVTEAVADKLAASLLGSGEAPNKILLSRGNAPRAPIFDVIKMLGENAADPVKTGEKTGGQVLNLSLAGQGSGGTGGDNPQGNTLLLDAVKAIGAGG